MISLNEQVNLIEQAFDNQTEWEDADLPTGEQVAFILDAIWPEYEKLLKKIERLESEIHG